MVAVHQLTKQKYWNDYGIIFYLLDLFGKISVVCLFFVHIPRRLIACPLAPQMVHIILYIPSWDVTNDHTSSETRTQNRPGKKQEKTWMLDMDPAHLFIEEEEDRKRLTSNNEDRWMTEDKHTQTTGTHKWNTIKMTSLQKPKLEIYNNERQRQTHHWVKQKHKIDKTRGRIPVQIRTLSHR